MKHIDKLKSKLFNQPSLLEKVSVWKAAGEQVVFTNGCFDLLHRGHVDYLNKAADLGTKLVIGLNSDKSVMQQNKGPARPIQDQDSRAEILAALECVDAVVLFDDETPQALISKLLPQVLAKGADYKVEEIAGHKEVLANGGKVELIEFLEGYSTSGIEEKIRKTY